MLITKEEKLEIVLRHLRDGINSAGGLLGEIFGGASDDPYEEEDMSTEPPQCVLDLTGEEDILLNGELKDGVYVNAYFGIKLTVPEGGTLIRDSDDVTESTEILPLRQAYEDGWACLYFTAEADELDGYINVSISALMDDEVGLSARKNPA